MYRNISKLTENQFDVIIVGGGIHGAAAAWQCSAQGMKVALVEKNDFGGVTSANSLKIIHGGFRYLQHLNIKRMRESIISRRIMSHVSPHNVKALRCAIPNSGFGLQSRLIMRLALFINDIIAFDRNKDVSKECWIPSGKVISLEHCKDLFPLVDWSGKTGGAVWYDAIAHNSERLTLDFIKQAVKMGACVANYVEMRELFIDDSILRGCVAFDSINKEMIQLQGKTVVMTGGASNDRLLGIHQNKKDIQKDWARAVNIVVSKELLRDTAIGLSGQTDFVDSDAVIKKKGRFFFFVPWRGYTMIGTTYSFDSPHSAEDSPAQFDISEILVEVNSIFPKAGLSLSDVSKVHTGFVPAYSRGCNKEDEVQLVKETEIFNLGKKIVNPVNGLFAVKSVKYTTAPIVAMDVANQVSKFLGLEYNKTNLKNSIGIDKSSDTEASTFNCYETILGRYGQDCEGVLRYLHKDSVLICDDPPVYEEEIDYFVQEEMALTLSDVVMRRSEIATAECPHRHVLMKIANRMAGHLEWDKEKIETEVETVENDFNWN